MAQDRHIAVLLDVIIYPAFDVNPLLLFPNLCHCTVMSTGCARPAPSEADNGPLLGRGEEVEQDEQQ